MAIFLLTGEIKKWKKSVLNGQGNIHAIALTPPPPPLDLTFEPSTAKLRIWMLRIVGAPRPVFTPMCVYGQDFPRSYRAFPAGPTPLDPSPSEPLPPT